MWLCPRDFWLGLGLRGCHNACGDAGCAQGTQKRDNPSLGCWSSDIPVMPPAAAELTKPPQHHGEFGWAAQPLPPERSTEPAVRKRGRQPARNALIGLTRAKHTACNIYKRLIRPRNRSAGLKTLGT